MPECCILRLESYVQLNSGSGLSYVLPRMYLTLQSFAQAQELLL